MSALRRKSAPAGLYQAGYYQSEGLPPPDYSGSSEATDANLEMPVILPYDEWRSGTAATALASVITSPRPAAFPAPPEELLADSSLPEPPPDYEASNTRQESANLIPPHKLRNPVLESKNHKELNREIKLIARQGINPLETKPELQKEFERRKFENRKKELSGHQKNRTSLEQQLERQLQKITDDEEESKSKLEKERNKSELERIQERILAHSS